MGQLFFDILFNGTYKTTQYISRKEAAAQRIQRSN